MSPPKIGRKIGRKQRHLSQTRDTAAPARSSPHLPPAVPAVVGVTDAAGPVVAEPDPAAAVLLAAGLVAPDQVPDDQEPFDREREQTVSVKEAAFRLKKSHDTIYRWLRAGRLQGWQLGGTGCSIIVREKSVTQALLRSLGRGNMVIRKHPEMAASAAREPAGRAAM